MEMRLFIGYHILQNTDYFGGKVVCLGRKESANTGCLSTSYRAACGFHLSVTRFLVSIHVLVVSGGYSA